MSFKVSQKKGIVILYWKKILKHKITKMLFVVLKTGAKKLFGGLKKLASKKTLKILYYLFLLVVVGITIVFAYYYKTGPSLGELVALHGTSSTKIYDRTGTEVLYDIYDTQKRTVVQYEDIPQDLIDATIVTEDDKFFEHFGIDAYGVVRAAFVNIVQGRVSQGGSTITQQLIKNAYFTPEQGVAPRTVGRKIEELILSVQLELKYSKEEILWAYLNRVPYGAAYGVGAGAQTYFQKDVQDLTLAESALLASLPQAPSYYINNKDELKKRQENILMRMKQLGYITEQEYQDALEEEIRIEPRYDKIIAPHFVLEVKQQLEDRYGAAFVEQGGLQVITTLDLGAQKVAEDAINQFTERNQTNYNASNAALVAIDHTTGHIIAMAGSKDYFNEDIDGNVNVTMRPRQPGSSFKPFAYATAFRKGYTANTVVYDVKTEFNPTCDWEGEEEYGSNRQRCYHPQNYEGGYFGAISLKEALAQSRNIPAVKILYLVGLKDTIELAENMGISTLTNKDAYGLSLVLGGGEVTLLEETAAYGVFATGGEYRKPLFILEVRDSNGEILDSFSSAPKRVLEKNITDQITHSLSVNEYRVPVFGERNVLQTPNLASAAKTGTTQEYKDAWTVGYTPSISVGVWGGNNDNTSMRQGAGGSRVAAPIWNSFLTNLYKLKQDESEEVRQLNNYFSLPDPQTERFTLTTIPTTNKDSIDGVLDEQTPHTILHFVEKRDPLKDAPKNPEQEDDLYEHWERAVRAWAGLQYGVDEPVNESDIIKIIAPKDEYGVGQEIPLVLIIESPQSIQDITIYLNGNRISEHTVFNETNFAITDTITGLNTTGEHTLSVRLSTKTGSVYNAFTSFSTHNPLLISSFP